MKRCPDCEAEKPDTEFAKNKNEKDGLACYCRGCMSKRRKGYRSKGARRDVKRHGVVVLRSDRIYRGPVGKPIKKVKVKGISMLGSVK